MAFNFPNSPTLGQQVSNTGSGQTFTWDGTSWNTTPVTSSQAITSSFAQVSNYSTKIALFNNSNNTYGSQNNLNWSDVRWNNFTTDEIQTTDNINFTLKNGAYLVEWSPSYLTGEYVFADLYLNGSLYRLDDDYARASAGGGGNWGGQTWKAAVIDARTSNQSIRVNGQCYTSAQLKITKIA